jgi:hypothetical protein
MLSSRSRYTILYAYLSLGVVKSDLRRARQASIRREEVRVDQKVLRNHLAKAC